MAVEFEPLVFEIRQGSNDASKGVDALVQSLGKLKTVTGNLSVLTKTTNQLKKLNAELNKFQNVDKLAKLAGALASLSKISNIKVPTGFYKNLAGIAGATTILTEEGVSRFERLATALKEVGRVGNIRIPNTKVPTSNTTTVLPTTPKDSGVAHSAGMTEAQNRINAARSAIASARQQVEQMRASTAEAVRQSEAFANALRGIIQAAEIAASVIHWFIAAVKVIINVLKKVASAIKTVITQAKRLAVAVGKVLLRPFISLAEQIKKSIEGVKQFFNSIARIAMYRLIRGAIAALTQGLQEGMENLYQYSKIVGTDFANAMDRMATNALYVKNSLAAMVSPIIEALAPAVDFLTDKFVELLNTVNMFIARLLGKETYTVAKRVAAVWQEVGDNTEDATKKLKSYTIGIDELNIIEETGNERDSSWSPDIDYRKWFEELPTESNWITEFADKLKEAFENGDWQTLGTLLGDKINDLIDSIDWEGIGSTIGYYLDGAIKTAYYFLKEIDFQKAGAAVATLINNLLEAVDWEYLGRLLVVKITSMWDFAIGFLQELDWGEVGHSIFTFIIGALNEFSEWLNEIDWVDLGETLLKKIQDFFEEFDFKEVIKTVSRVLGETVRSMKDLLTPLWESLKEWWNEHIKGKNFLETIKNLGDYLLKFVDEYILTPFLTALVGEEGMGGKSGLGKLKEIGENILLGILKGISDWITNKLHEWLMNMLLGPFVVGLMKVFGIHSPAETMIPIGENILLGLLQGITDNLEKVADVVVKIIEAIGNAVSQSIATLFEVGSKIVNAIGDGVAQSITTLFGVGIKIVNAIGDGVAQSITTLFGVGIKIVNAIGDGVDQAITTLFEVGTKIVKAIGDGVAQAITTLFEVGTKIVKAIGDGVAQAITTLFEVGTKIVKVIGDGVAQSVTTLFGVGTNIVKAIGDGVAQSVTTLFGVGTNIVKAIGDGISSAISTISQATNMIITAIVTSLAVNKITQAVSNLNKELAKIKEKIQVTVSLKKDSGFDSNLVSILKSINSIPTGRSVTVSAKISDGFNDTINNVTKQIGNLTNKTVTLTVSVKYDDKGFKPLPATLSVQVQYKDPGFKPVPATQSVQVQYKDPGFKPVPATQSVQVQYKDPGFKPVPATLSVPVQYNDPGFKPLPVTQMAMVQYNDPGFKPLPVTQMAMVQYNDPGFKPAPVMLPVNVVYDDPGFDPPDAQMTVHVNYDDPGYGGGHATGAILTQPTFFHAVGGIVDRPTFFHAAGATHVMGEAGREAILPLQNHTEWMSEIAERVDERMSGDEDLSAAFFKQALQEFYYESLQPVMSNMDVNMQRQADKDERPVVRIGQRDIKDAYDRQSKADGYRFTR